MQDIHTHLYWESFDEDRDDVIKRAQEAGVNTMLVVGTTLEESQKAISLSEKYEGIFATVGIHPNEFRKQGKKNLEKDWPKFLEDLAKMKGVVAIGECGLDYSESHGDITPGEKNLQKEGFIQQIALAKQSNLPLIIHCRAKNTMSDDAYWDLLGLLQIHAGELKHVVLHCYMGSVSVTEAFLQIPNVSFSFTGNITYPVKKDIQGGNFDLTESVKLVPLEKIFVETDCPFLAPQEYRGKRNEPAYVVYVAQKIAELHGVSVEKVALETEKNFRLVFGIED